tara:strand:- start:2041 stop:2427 length:387 start_codon:yes stop_codon:yes gene_type:complete
VALPDPVYPTELSKGEYVEQVTAAASTTTNIVLAADVGADQRVVCTHLRIQSSAASGLNFENDSDSSHITERLGVAAQRMFIQDHPGGVLVSDWGSGVQVVNPVGTDAEVTFCYRIQDRDKYPSYENG